MNLLKSLWDHMPKKPGRRGGIWVLQYYAWGINFDFSFFSSHSDRVRSIIRHLKLLPDFPGVLYELT